MPLAISIAASIRVGNLLGAQRPTQAQLAAKICLVIGVATMLLCGMVLVLLRGYVNGTRRSENKREEAQGPMTRKHTHYHRVLGNIFTSDTKVVKIVSQLCPIMALYQVFDGFQVSSR